MSAFFTPLLRFFSVLAGIAWIPIATLWFGYGFGAITFVIFNAVFFVVAYNTLLGVTGIPMPLRHAAASLGAGALAMLTEVLLPGALPNIVTGIRTGLGFAWRGLIAAEMIATNVGLGYMLFVARDFYRTEVIVLGMIVIGVLWLLIDRLLLAPLERATIERWGMVRGRMNRRPCPLGRAVAALCMRARTCAGGACPALARAACRSCRWSRCGRSSPQPGSSRASFFPGPVEVVRSFGTLDGTTASCRPISRTASCASPSGTAAGMAIGIPLGLLVGLSDRAHRLLWPVLLFFQAIGDIAWLPILLIWFGFGLTTMTFVIVYTVLFPVVLNTVLGVRSVPLELHRAALTPRRVARAHRSGRWCCPARCRTSSPACATASATAGAR